MFDITVFRVSDISVEVASFQSNIMPEPGQLWSVTPGGQTWHINRVVFSPANKVSVFIL